MSDALDVKDLRRASREIVRELGFLGARYDEADLSHSEAHALIEVAEQPGLSQSALCDVLCLDKSTTSRVVARLTQRGLLKVTSAVHDARRRALGLSREGARRLVLVHGPANARVGAALATLSTAERKRVLEGMSLYAQALRRTRGPGPSFELRPLRKEDNRALQQIVNECLSEFGAGGPGFVNADPDFKDLYASYQRPRSAYFVVTKGNRVLGGGGVAHLKGAPVSRCEFQKMYLLPQARGHGLGQRILDMCLSTARELGYRDCYLETLDNMKAARGLYEKNGFRALRKPVGATGHFGCNAWYLRRL